MNHLRRSLLLCLLVFTLAGPLFAGTTVVGTGSPASCTEAALDAAITVANGTFGVVTFNCGAAPHTLVVGGEKALATGVVVDGGGNITLSGGNATRIFSLFQGAVVQLQNLTLSQGFAAGGGCLAAVSSSEKPATLILANVTFSGCRSSTYGGAIGAILANLTISDSRFVGNVAETGGGGALSLNAGGLDLDRSTFVDNEAIDQGGALQIWFSTADLADVTFFRNRVEGSGGGGLPGGGALLLRDSSAALRRSRAAFGTVAIPAGGGGGAGIMAIDGTDVLLEDTTLESNYASGGDGGGLYLDDSSTADLRRSTLVDNRASNGGGVLATGGLELANTTFAGNRVFFRGPGLALRGGARLDMVSSTLIDNVSLLEPELTGQLDWSAGVSVTAHNTLISDLRQATNACAGGTAGNFSFSIWRDSSCGGSATNGNRPNTWARVNSLSRSCGGLAPDLAPSYGLLPGANAAVDNGSCRPGDPTIDQRGVARPQGGACDVGAAEFLAACDGPLFADGFESGTTASWN